MNAQQLRNSILQEAIHGRLVPQDPADEPASVLLQRIRKEKERLVMEGKLKKKDLESKPIEDDEIPFGIPKGWEWCVIGDLFAHNNGKQLNKGNAHGKMMDYITTSNLYWEGFSLDKIKQMPFEENEIERCQAIKGDLLVCEGGDIGRAAIWNYENPIMLQNHLHKLRSYIPLCTEYFYYIFYYYNKLGMIGGKGIGIQGFSSTALHNTKVPLPPLPEQHRIVAKIEELLPLVEQYGKAQAELEDLNRSLPDKLKKSVLQEAIQGRLVPQDPTDEPASVLLQRIRKEKERLVKEGKLKKKDLENKPIEEEEIPFEIPKGWEWVRICDISRSYIGLTYAPNEVSQNGIIVLRSSNIKNGKIDLSDIVRVKKEISDKLLVEKNDIIICARNGSKKLVGKSAIITNIEEPMTFGAFMAICKTQFYKYVYVFLQSDLFFSQLRNVSSTTTINQLTQNNFNNFLIPIPPLAEQRRIVAKIEELFKKIDGLKG
jgi:type I restriction enzyme S subunit